MLSYSEVKALASGNPLVIEESHVASLGGFDVRLSGYRLNDYRELRLTTHFGEGADSEVRLKRHDLHDPELNVVARLEGPIRRLDAERERTLGSLEATETEAEEIEARIGQPFPHRDRLDGLRRRHQEILDQLNVQAEEEARAEADRKAFRPPLLPARRGWTTSGMDMAITRRSRARACRAERRNDRSDIGLRREATPSPLATRPGRAKGPSLVCLVSHLVRLNG